MRDHMSDLELVLVALGETAAVTLGRNRGSHGIEQLLADAQDAGRIAGLARQQIEQGSAKRPVADRADVERLTAPRPPNRAGDRSESVESSAHRAEPASAG